MDTRSTAEAIIRKFSIPGSLVDIKVNTQGHINSTFISTFEKDGEKAKYTHQRINSNVFPHPDEVMENIVRVTEHIRKKTAGLPDAERRSLRVIMAADGRPYTIDDEGMYWRTYGFIDGVKTYDKVPGEDTAYSLGKGIGAFQSELSDFDSSKLYTVIPRFHDMRMRYMQLSTSMEKDPKGRRKLVEDELSFLWDNKERGERIWDGFENGTLPSRVTHNDTKINNVLFAEDSGEALCVIDLDTIMPGTVLFDTGDMIRTACSTADEDEKDLTLMEFHLPYYKALIDGYMEAASSFLTDGEKEGIKESGRTITQIMAVRFLADYLNGDIYYRTEEELVSGQASAMGRMKALQDQQGEMEVKDEIGFDAQDYFKSKYRLNGILFSNILAHQFKTLEKVQDRRVPAIFGPPGIGKTAGVEATIKRIDSVVNDFFGRTFSVPHMDSSQFSGPMAVNENDEVYFSSLSKLNFIQKNSKKGTSIYVNGQPYINAEFRCTSPTEIVEANGKNVKPLKAGKNLIKVKLNDTATK